MIENDWDIFFREKLKSIWLETKEIIKSELDKELVENQLKSIANDFLKTFNQKGSIIPVQHAENFYSSYHSVFIPLGTFAFLVPYDFYSLAKLKNPPNLDNLFATPVSWHTFLSYYYETIKNIRKPINDSDVIIMAILTRYQPKASDKVIPFSMVEVAKLAGSIGKRKKKLSENTVGKHLAYIWNESIFEDLFLINPWSIGYTLKTIIYERKLDSTMNKWDDWTKYKQIYMSNKIMRIIQVPQHAEDEFKIPDNVKSEEIIEYWHSNNISQLNSKEKDSFTSPPNFEVMKISDYKYVKFFKENDVKWIDNLLNMTYSTKTRKEESFASLNKISTDKRLKKALKFLDILSREQRIRTPYGKTAKRANLEEIVFLDFIRFFIDQKTINFATRTNFIGCNYRIGIFISSLEKPINEISELQLFLQNLLELPLINTFIGKHSIVTYIALPLKWVGFFITYLNILMTIPDLQIEFGTHMALQSYLHFNTPFSEDTVLTSYGVLYNPQFELSNAEIN